MDADWEVEIGGGAPVIEAEWPGFVDLRASPKSITSIAETATFSPLTALLLALNATTSPLWTSKCDVWEPEPAALACYIDMLPVEEKVFAKWQDAEAFCRQYIARVNSISSPSLDVERSAGRGHGINPGARIGAGLEQTSEGCITLVIREAVAGSIEGFGITAYLSAKTSCAADASAALGMVMAIFTNALSSSMPPQRTVQR